MMARNIAPGVNRNFAAERWSNIPRDVWYTERERARVRNAFSLYLAPEMVSELARSSDKLTLGGEQRMLSVMFTDIRSFSKHSEELSPAELGAIARRLHLG